MSDEFILGLLHCRACPRLAQHLAAQARLHPDHHNAPVPPVGPPQAPVLLVGLAPGADGANRTGMPFVGDPSARFLQQAMHAAGLSLNPDPDRVRVRITNAVKCLPPANKVQAAELNTCVDRWLRQEMNAPVTVALGRVAWRGCRRVMGLSAAALPFAMGAHLETAQGHLLVGLHPSPLNTRTGRLDLAGMTALLAQAKRLATAD